MDEKEKEKEKTEQNEAAPVGKELIIDVVKCLSMADEDECGSHFVG